jgi:hypothetical protein
LESPSGNFTITGINRVSDLGRNSLNSESKPSIGKVKSLSGLSKIKK